MEHKGLEECTKSEFDGVKSSNILMVILGNKISKEISVGVHIELGWDSDLGKKIHILIENDYVYSPILMGLSTLTNVIYYECNDFLNDSMLDKISAIIDEDLGGIK